MILTLGVLVNGLAYLPYTLIQSAGNSKTTAKIHIIEFCVYIPILISLTATIGIQGAAIAWTLGVFLELILLESQASKLAEQDFPKVRLVILLGMLLVLGAISFQMANWLKVMVTIVVGVVSLAILWRTCCLVPRPNHV